jgi:hypothetical protein
VLLFALFVFRRGARQRPESLVARGMIVAFAMISLVGMPGQEVPVAITFWTIAFWYTSLADVPDRPQARAVSWTPILVVVCIFAAGTAWAATTKLRVPVRAQRVGWPYSYGFYAPEPDGTGADQRWTDRHAVTVLDVPTPYFELTVAANPLAADRGGRKSRRGPIHVKVQVDGQRVIDQEVTTADPITRVIPIGVGPRRVLVETSVDRTYRPRDFGLPDDRDLGMLTKWRFLEADPTGVARSP